MPRDVFTLEMLMLSSCSSQVLCGSASCFTLSDITAGTLGLPNPVEHLPLVTTHLTQLHRS